MTDRALDELARRVMLDAARQEYGAAIKDRPEHDFSAGFEHKMRKLIRRADHPVRYWTAKAAACFLLAALLGCTVLAISPTAWAAFTRWVTEWYETHVVYRYAGRSILEALPQYEITELPEGFVEIERIEFQRMASITYENESGDVIYFNYVFMSHGGAVSFGTKDSDIFDIKVNHMSGQFFESKVPGNFNTITWIDADQNIQFDISGTYSYADILRMAESVSLVKTTK